MGLGKAAGWGFESLKEQEVCVIGRVAVFKTLSYGDMRYDPACCCGLEGVKSRFSNTCYIFIIEVNATSHRSFSK